MGDSRSPQERGLLVAFFASGAAALGYEIVWTRLLVLTLGSESLAVFATLAGFFLGMVLGAFALDRSIRRSRRPERWFAFLEIGAASYALASPLLLTWAQRTLPPWLGAGANDTFSAVASALAIAAVLLLPGTACLGATFAALTETLHRQSKADDSGSGLGRLYAANLLGACLGILVTVYGLLPSLGVWGALLCLVPLSLFAASLAWRLGSEAQHAPGDDAELAPTGRMGLFGVLFVSGFLAIGFEVVGLQVLGQVLENTIFTFANLLAVFLLGNAAGAWIYQRVTASRPKLRSAALPAAGLAVSLPLAGFVLATAPMIVESVAPQDASGALQVLAEIILSGLVFGPASLFMGALFTNLMAPLVGRAVGWGYGWNTLGSTCAPFVLGAGLIGSIGCAAALRAVFVGYVLLFAVVASGRARWLGLVALALLAFTMPRDLFLVEPLPGLRLVDRRDGLFGVVLVTEKPPQSDRPPAIPERFLQLNKHFYMGGGLSFAEHRMGHLGLLLAPDAKRALFLGVGTGATLGIVAHHSVADVDAVEIIPEILETLPLFAAVNGNVHQQDKVRLHCADARRFLVSRQETYDLITCDLYHPGRDGASSLYSYEHFRALRTRANSDGLVVQWLPLFQLDPDGLRTIVRTFLEVFPETHAFLGIFNAHQPNLALVGRRSSDPLRIDLTHIAQHLADSPRTRQAISDVQDLLSMYVAGPADLKKLAGDAPIHRDLNPSLLLGATLSAYQETKQLAGSCLDEITRIRTHFPRNLLLNPQSEPSTLDRWERTWKAVGPYLEAERLRLESSSDDPAVIQKTLESFALAPSFVPARGALLRWSAQREHAVSILEGMLEVTSDDPELYRMYLIHLRDQNDADGFRKVLERARENCGEEAFPRRRES